MYYVNLGDLVEADFREHVEPVWQVSLKALGLAEVVRLAEPPFQIFPAIGVSSPHTRCEKEQPSQRPAQGSNLIRDE